jgi:hypothetical protein
VVEAAEPVPAKRSTRQRRGHRRRAGRCRAHRRRPPDRILHVDPAELIIGANVRVDPRLDKTFLASIKADGLAEVITVYRNES